MAISLSDHAAQKIRAQIEKNGKGFGIRLGVRKVGCSGFAYTLDYVDAAKDDDQLFVSGNINVVVDPTSLTMIDGSQVDFVKQGFNEVLKVTNPNAESECGCGESFNLKKKNAVA
ncbi:HesB/IscA family protein [Actimicrobium antarcticum]|uniref:Iron-sulfur cluster assembly protein IscA n=1 Tax=Actimicrobium antarcticum TaxID=1051899 RepID=A0ABP7SVF0_9BURK